MPAAGSGSTNAARASVPILYFDLGSPYAYLACERAPAVLGEHELEPILLGGIFRLRGFGSWAPTPARAPRVAELEDRARRYGLPPLQWPSAWPADGLRAMRCAVWAKREGALDAFARAVFRLEFADGADIAEPAVLARAASQAGLDEREMEQAVVTEEIKGALRDATDAAWQAGVRGVPSVRAGASVFYGDDQLELAASV